MTLTVGSLTTAHHGKRAVVELNDGARTGVLSHGRNPAYPRRDVTHWWLIVPSALPHFTHDALSLQWAGGAVVNLIEEQS